MHSCPSISVVMPVYNYGHLIKESIDSVLTQSMLDFELIIVNDGSLDNSSEIAHSYLDKRLKVIDFPENRGNYPARNAGMRMATGKYICVTDADDLCLPDRLEKQFLFMEMNKEIGLIGGGYKTADSSRNVFRETDYEIIKIMLLRYCYLHHPTCMIRTKFVEKYNLYYNESYRYASDHDWEVRASSFFPISNINDPVLLYRKHARQISINKRNEQSIFADQIRLNQLSFFGIEPTKLEKELHLAFINGVPDSRINEKWIDQWINRLLETNRNTRCFSQQALRKFLQAHRYLSVNQIKDI